MSKSNVTSIRYSDEVKEIIEEQEGSSFSEKFHNLILYCYKKLPALKQKEIRLNQEIDRLYQEIDNLKTSICSLEQIEIDLKKIHSSIDKLEFDLKNM